MDIRLGMVWMYTVLFFISCGISDIPFFSAASVSTIAGESIVKIDHNTANNDKSFLGYNIYYKLYKDSDVKTISSDRNYIKDTTRQPTPSVITTKKFMLLKTVKVSGSSFETFREDDPPMIRPKDKKSSQSFYIDFGASPASSELLYKFSENVYIKGSGDERGYQALLVTNGSATILRRNLNTNDTKSFFDTASDSSYKISDYDIKKMIGSKYTKGDSLLVVIAVIPYGIDISAVQRVYGNIAMSKEMRLDYTSTP